MHRWLIVLLAMACGCAPSTLATDAPGAYLRGRFSAILGGGIQEASVCIGGQCELTDGQGRFALDGLPEASDVVVRVDKEGFFRTNLPHHTADSEPAWDKKLLGLDLMEDQARRADTELLPDRGHFSFMAHEAHFREGTVKQTAGVRFTVEPSAAGSTAYFLSQPFQFADASLEETTGAGGGGLLNLPPGRYRVRFEGPDAPCSRILSWDFDPNEGVDIEIEAGRGTYIDVLCPPG